MENSFDIEAFLRKAVAVGASDIHLQSGEHPAIRVDGKIVKVDMPVLADDEFLIAALLLFHLSIVM